MYLAGLLADEKQISKAELRRWAEQATWYMISEYTVAWIAAESPHGWELALEWIDSDREAVASSGWATLSNLCVIRPDSHLDLEHLKKMLDRAAAALPAAPNRVRYTMNGFVMACGISVAPLHDYAIQTAEKIGEVHVDVGDTACQVPLAAKYIRHAEEKGKIGYKKKMARC